MEATVSHILVSQVAEIGERLDVTLKQAEERVVHLEKLAARWTTLQSEVAEVKTWSVQEAPVALQSLHSLETSPRDKLSKAQQLQTHLNEKESLIAQLSNVAEELIKGMNDQLYVFTVAKISPTNNFYHKKLGLSSNLRHTKLELKEYSIL